MPDHLSVDIWCARVECQKKISKNSKMSKNGIFIWQWQDEKVHKAMPFTVFEMSIGRRGVAGEATEVARGGGRIYF